MLREYILDGTEPNKGILDFSSLLDAPAGKHGFVKSVGGHTCFEDGKRVRFVGVSMVGAGCLPDHDTADAVAARLASSGLNLVRMHYMDGRMGKKSAVRLIDYSKGSSRELSEDGLERLDYFVWKLKLAGIYVQLDTFVGRNWMPEGDELDYKDELPQNWAPKQSNIFNRRMIELQKEYQTKLLGHTNPYTKLRYADDPAVAAVQIMNENSLLWDFGSNFNMDTLPLHYKLELKEKWRLYLKAKYRTNDRLKKAWTDMNGVCALMTAVEHVDFMVQLPTAPYSTNDIVGAEHTEPQTSLNCQTRMSDFIDFLIGIENSFYREMNENLTSIGVRCLVNASNLVRGMANVYTTAKSGSIQEQDSYYNHPYLGFAPPAKVMQRPMVKADPRANLFGQATDCNMLTNDATAAVYKRPLMVAEWNVVNPTPFDADGMLEMASYCSLQDWDGFCCFMYNERSNIDALRSHKMDFYFTLFNDPSKWGQIGISSYIFQKQCVSRARNTVYICPTKDDIRANAQPTSMVPYASLPYFSKVAVRLPDEDFAPDDNDIEIAMGYTPTGDFTQSNHAIVFSDSPYADLKHKSEGRSEYLERHREKDSVPFFGIGRIGKHRLVIDRPQEFSHDPYIYGDVVSEAMRRWGMLSDKQGIVHGTDFVSDTDEISASPDKGTFKVTTPMFAAFAGVPEKLIDLGIAEAEIKNEYIALSMLSRDDKTLCESSHILLTAIGKTMNTGVKFDGEWLTDLGHEPVVVDQAEGTLRLRAARKLTVYALKPDGSRREALPVENGSVTLTTEIGTIHYELILE